MKTLFLAGVALAAAAAQPAFAQSGAAQPTPARPTPARPGVDRVLTRADVQSRVQTRFARADADKDGFVTREEAQARRAEGRERLQAGRGERRAALFARLDSNRDGALSREEFEAPRARMADGARNGRGGHRFAGRMGGRGGAMAGAGFARLDSDGDGRISLQEAQSAALRMFDRADANRDGAVTPDERRAAREAFRARRG
jgi:EF-hand domain pair/EF hand